MYYRPGEPSGLARDPWMMCVVPRPIGWISSISPEGRINLAPYSFFNAVAEDPPMVMFASNGAHPHGAKDTARNVRATGEFVCNMATFALRAAVKHTSAPVDAKTDEFALARLEMLASTLVRPPRVAASPIHLECRFVTALELPPERGGAPNTLIVGEVVGIHISDEVIVDGLVDLARFKPLARLGYDRFASVETSFAVTVPGGGEPSHQDREAELACQ